MALLSKFRLVLFLAAMIGFYIVERYLRFEAYHLYVLIATLAVAGLATVIPFWGAIQSKKSGKVGEAASLLLLGVWQLSVLTGAGCFVFYQYLVGTAGGPETFSTKALLALWLLLIILGGFSGVGLELAHANAGTGSLAEPKRVRRAGFSWLMVGMVLCTLTCFNYVGAHKNKSFDWSYLKTTTPSSSTINIVKTQTEPIDVHIFFAYDNEVRPFVVEYFSYLEDRGGNIKVFEHDKDMEPNVAEDLKVSRNGQVIFKAGDKRERIDVGLDLTAARQMLKKLDSEVQKQVLRLSADRKKIYFTRGHGELSWSNASKDPMRSIDLFETLMRQQNYSVGTLSLADGSATKIPDDAGAVIIVGHDAPFHKEEVDALWTYLEGGGRLAVFLEPAGSTKEVPSVAQGQADPLLAMLAKSGLTFERKLLANDRNYVPAFKSAADHWFLFSNSFSSHESVTNLSKNDERAALFMFQVGYFEVAPQMGDWRATTTVRSVGETFVDANKNMVFDAKNEKRQTYTIGAVATKAVATTDKDAKKIETDAKIIAFADATAFSDALIRNRPNALYVVDSMKWLTGQADLMGELTSEEDVKIQHTNKEDAIWFNATVVLVPLFVLVLGFVATRKRKTKG